MPDEMNNDPLEQAHQSVYGQQAAPTVHRSPLSALREQIVPRDWGTLAPAATTRGKRHVRFATIFLAVSASFFLIALVVVGYLLYFGNNSVSANKITIDIQGPTTIAGGDTVPLSIAITNKNAIAINDATIEIDFPNSTRSATDVLSDYPRYIDNLGTIPSGGTVTRSIKAIIFGGAGQALSLPVVLSYNISTSNGTFQKKTSYDLAISSTPLSVSVDTLNEITPGQPLSFTLTVRSNANVAISNVMLVPQFPFGFSIASSSVPFSNAGFALGTFAPGATQRVTFVGTVAGQDNDQKMFHFAVGTAKSAKDQSLAITYMSQDASVTLTSPFITTSIAINGTSESNIVLTPGSIQNVSLSYTNTLATVITNASIVVSVTGSGINYDSIRAGSGFYNSSDHTIVFNRDTNPALAMLAPGASGMGSFSFLTLPAGVASPNIVFTTNASGTRIGQENVPEQVTTSVVKAIKVVTSPTIVAMAERNTSPFSETGRFRQLQIKPQHTPSFYRQRIKVAQ